MASVDIGPAVLCLADDPSQRIVAYTAGWSDQTVKRVEVREMAGGRLRAVTRAGSRRSLGWTMRKLTKAQVLLAEDWAGRVVMIRDRQGRKEYGVYAEVTVTDRRAGDLHDVVFALQSVTFVEA